jgi:hypothetical protein
MCRICLVFIDGMEGVNFKTIVESGARDDNLTSYWSPKLNQFCDNIWLWVCTWLPTLLDMKNNQIGFIHRNLATCYRRAYTAHASVLQWCGTRSVPDLGICSIGVNLTVSICNWYSYHLLCRRISTPTFW